MKSSITILALHFICCPSGQMDMERARLPVSVTLGALIFLAFFNSIFLKFIQKGKPKWTNQQWATEVVCDAYACMRLSTQGGVRWGL